MKNSLFIVCLMFILAATVSGQKYEPVTVKAGMKVADCFPLSERYRYPEFIPGRMQLKSGVYSEAMLNYDFLSAEMVFIRNKDTMAIGNPKELSYVAVAQDTFYYDKGFYFEILSSGPVKVGLKQYLKLKETLKQDSYGSSSSGSAINSYGSLPSQGNFYKLTANTDMVFQRTLEYYILDQSGEFVSFTRKKVLRQYPGKEKNIKAYLKANKVNFGNREDLLRFAGFLSTL